MRQTPLRVTVLGRCDPADRPVVADAMLLLPQDAEIDRLPEFAARWLEVAAAADLCIVFESWPDEIPEPTAHAVIAACAAGRLICCQGQWCASSGRTRSIWPPAVCVSVEQFSARLAFELSVLGDETPPLPATASRDEAFAAHYVLPPDSRAIRAAVTSSDPTYARELHRALDSATRPDAPDGTIIDADHVTPDALPHAGSVRLAVAAFPRPEQISAWQVAGVRGVVSKLAPLSELRSVIERALADDHSAAGHDTSR